MTIVANIPVPRFFEQGGATMWVLGLCSLVALTFIIERVLFWVAEQGRRHPAGVDRMIAAAQEGDFAAAEREGKQTRDFVARMLAYGLAHRDAAIRDSLELAAAAELKRMKRFLPVLDTIITIAPLLGILGTVIGIIDSFEVLQDAAIQDPRAVVGGIAKALVTTVGGLIISIATLVPYNFFLTRVEGAAGEMAHRGTQLEILVKKGGRTDAD